ncbi:helix-turn-helix domain-containing protein [Phytoactinopolyspora halotolerans]|uniref:Helix-turn-helix domain-containing protein n=1 Tax=Phytoactinopolyspora halotolerans TaxID=1981512 RepID=A0A6L9SCF7_9ACTN|nr:helix-turn-helix domain-containing protein [Phytoactinopolyspora halotolerans]NEE03065.1 helix-turn-helix domain-containing protein [Phytoactinopolyspora halotolerans]
MTTTVDQPIGQIIRSARQRLGLSQYVLADQLAAISGKSTMGRDRIARWERGSQVPRSEWRQWLAAVLDVPAERLDAGAEAARRQNRLGHAMVTATAPNGSHTARRSQGTPALLPVFRSRVQAGILAATLLNPNRAFSLSELAEQAGGSLASVSKESKLLEEAGILYTRYDGAIRLIRAATDEPMLTPLTELIRVTYGVPQVIGEEFGRVPGIGRIALVGTWAERFAGLIGPEPDSIQVRIAPQRNEKVSDQDLAAAARRAQTRLHRPVTYNVVHPPPRAGDAANGRTPNRTAPARVPAQRRRRPVVQIVSHSALNALPPAADAWTTGADKIRKFLDDGQLELFSGDSADARPYFEVADAHLTSAEEVAGHSPGSAFVLLCQAVRSIALGLLAAQGLRPVAGSRASVLGQAVVAQFGPQFRQVELLRERLLELDDPTWRDNRIGDLDVHGAIPAARSLLKTSQDLAIELNLFT